MNEVYPPGRVNPREIRNSYPAAGAKNIARRPTRLVESPVATGTPRLGCRRYVSPPCRLPRQPSVALAKEGCLSPPATATRHGVVPIQRDEAGSPAGTKTGSIRPSTMLRALRLSKGNPQSEIRPSTSLRAARAWSRGRNHSCPAAYRRRPRARPRRPRLGTEMYPAVFGFMRPIGDRNGWSSIVATGLRIRRSMLFSWPRSS